MKTTSLKISAGSSAAALAVIDWLNWRTAMAIQRDAGTGISHRLKRVLTLGAVIGLGLTMAGCTTSQSAAAKLTLHSHSQTALNVMPFGAARKEFATSSASLLGLMTGFDSHKFKQADYANLRSSILKSVQQSGSFARVDDIIDSSQTVTGLRLHIDLETAGLKRTTWGLACVLKGKARVENEAGTVLSSGSIDVDAESLTTLGDAKNKAIHSFVSEIGGVLNDIK